MTTTRSPTPATVVCSACAAAGDDAAARLDLRVDCLVPDPGSVTEAGDQIRAVPARFCRDCAPHASVAEVTCLGCGDGPLLTGALTRPDLAALAAVDAALDQQGWTTPGPWCPGCRPRR